MARRSAGFDGFGSGSRIYCAPRICRAKKHGRRRADRSRWLTGECAQYAGECYSGHRAPEPHSRNSRAPCSLHAPFPAGGYQTTVEKTAARRHPGGRRCQPQQLHAWPQSRAAAPRVAGRVISYSGLQGCNSGKARPGNAGLGRRALPVSAHPGAQQVPDRHAGQKQPRAAKRRYRMLPDAPAALLQLIASGSHTHACTLHTAVAAQVVACQRRATGQGLPYQLRWVEQSASQPASCCLRYPRAGCQGWTASSTPTCPIDSQATLT